MQPTLNVLDIAVTELGAAIDFYRHSRRHRAAGTIRRTLGDALRHRHRSGRQRRRSVRQPLLQLTSDQPH